MLRVTPLPPTDTYLGFRLWEYFGKSLWIFWCVQNMLGFIVLAVTSRCSQLLSSRKQRASRCSGASDLRRRGGGVWYSNQMGVLLQVYIDKHDCSCNSESSTVASVLEKKEGDQNAYRAYSLSSHLHPTVVVLWKLHSTFWCAGDKSKQLRELSRIQ